MPASARRKPSSVSTVVVFPAPLGPSKATTSPGSASKLMPPTADEASVPDNQVIDLHGRHRREAIWGWTGLAVGAGSDMSGQRRGDSNR